MDRATLEEKLKALQTHFDTIQQEKQNHERQAQDAEAELLRLQGDYRTIENLIKEIDRQPAAGEVLDPLTITAKEDKEVKHAAN